MKVLIIGAEGMLGHDLVEVMSKNHEVSTTTIDTMDITDINKTIETVKKKNPDVVIHAAAFTDVDGSESQADLAYKVNSLGTRNVAVLAKKQTVHWFTYALIMFSMAPKAVLTMNTIKQTR